MDRVLEARALMREEWCSSFVGLRGICYSAHKASTMVLGRFLRTDKGLEAQLQVCNGFSSSSQNHTTK